MLAFAIALVNCGNDTHTTPLSNQFAFIRQAIGDSVPISSVQHHAQLKDQHAFQHARTLVQGAALKPWAVEIGPGSDSVVLMNSDGTGEQLIANLAGSFEAVQLAYDGKSGVAIARDINGQHQVYYANLTDKNNPVVTQLTTENVDHWSAQLSYDGKQVVYGKYVAAADADTAVLMSTSGGAETVLAPGTDVEYPTFTPDGKIVFTDDRTATISIMNADGSGMKPLISHTGTQWDWMPSVSPDGKTVTFYRCTSGAGCDIWTASMDGTGVKQITTDTYSWDPMFVNNKIVFLSERDTAGGNWNGQVYSMSPDGTNQKRLTNNSNNEYFDWW